MNPHLIRMKLAVLISFLLVVSARAGEFDSLLTKVPADANIVMLLNTDNIFASPIAQKENWRAQHEQAFASGMAQISPNVRHLVLATQMDLEVKQPTWNMAAAELQSPLSLPNFARERKGALDQIDGSAAVALRNDTYLIQHAANVVSVMTPANRQAVARWKRASDANTTPQLSSFITAALRDADQSAIVQTIDLQDAIPANVVRNWMAQASSVQGHKSEIDAFARVMSSIQGVLLEIRLTEQIVGRAIVVFDEDASALLPVAKPLFQEVLQTNGLGLDDLANWNVEVADKRLIFKGTLSKTSLKRMISLMDTSLADLTAPKEKNAAEDQYMAEKIMLEATHKYFKSLQSNLTELKGEVKNGATWGHMAQWIDYGAKQIDRQPQLNVDPAMLDYGMYVTTQLRGASAALRGIGINTGVRKAQVIPEGKAEIHASVGPHTYLGPYNGYGRSGSFSGYYEWRNVDAERRAITAEEKAKGATDARGIAALIDDATAKIRRAMTEKYRQEFR